MPLRTLPEIQITHVWKSSCKFLHCVSMTKTSHLYNLLLFLHTQFDCNNFWHKYCREIRQSKCTLFSHLT